MFSHRQQREISHTWKARRQCDQGGGDWRDMATNQGMPAAPGAERQGMHSPLGPLEGPQPWQLLDISPMILIWNSWLPELQKDTFLPL